MMWRYAVYWAPERSDPLHRLASAWLGRDAETNDAVAQPHLDDLDIREMTADARYYGVHATLKAPFRLEGTPASFVSAVRALSAELQPFQLPPLQVVDFRGFLALREAEPSPHLQALADRCVTDLDVHRAPLNATEIARRRPERLSGLERTYLDRWGYPQVLDCWEFHVTLSRRLSEAEMAAALPAAQRYLDGALAYSRTVREICLFGQAAQDAPFRLLERFALGTAAD